ncbi:hypothetical protein [Flavobacterium sp. Arc2]|uniref:hypothetical protein n=1 Tax=Flavobacterium sp. Arc2 TaxID=3046685 RepID=UPI00352E8CDE
MTYRINTFINYLKSQYLFLLILTPPELMSIQITNPTTNKILKPFDEMTDEQVQATIEKSNGFFKG